MKKDISTKTMLKQLKSLICNQIPHITGSLTTVRGEFLIDIFSF